MRAELFNVRFFVLHDHVMVVLRPCEAKLSGLRCLTIIGTEGDDQPEAREGQARRPGVAERFAVPLKPGNAGGGNGQSWFRKSAQGDKWSFCLMAGTLCPANQERP